MARIRAPWDLQAARRCVESSARYRAGGDGVLHVEIEAEVDHVEDSVAPQRGRQAFIQTFQPEPVRLYDASGLSERGGLLEGERARLKEPRRSSQRVTEAQAPV